MSDDYTPAEPTGGVVTEWPYDEWTTAEKLDAEAAHVAPGQADLLRQAAEDLRRLHARRADLARFGCPACDDTDPVPVMTCVRCGATYWAPQDAVARAFGEDGGE